MSIACVLIMKKSDVVILFDIDNTLFNTEKLKQTDLTTFELYDEVKEMLSELANVATLGIFSQGQIAFQNKKLLETNIHHYFSEEHKYIVDDKLETIKGVLSQYKNKAKIIVIDDFLEGLRFAKRHDPSIFTIWMKRGEYAHLQKEYSDFVPDAVIENLNDIVSIIAQL